MERKQKTTPWTSVTSAGMSQLAEKTQSNLVIASELLAHMPTPTAPLATTSSRVATAEARASAGQEDNLFEHFAWLYILFRERIFRNDTRRIIRNIWPSGSPEAGARLIELGCGPGFYSCELAKTFPRLDVIGIDQSPKQLQRAREKAAQLGLHNCRFESFDVLALPQQDESFTSVIASRLFTVLPEQTEAVAEMFRVLVPGGHCFVAEPRYAFWASIPLFLMRAMARLTGFKDDCHPDNVHVLSEGAFKHIFTTQPWAKIKVWTRGRCQYALCEKR